MAKTPIQERILELVRSRWESQRRAYTFVDLGYQLRKDFSRTDVERELLGGKLKNYVQYNLGNELRIITDPTNDTRVGLVPSTVTDSAENLFSQLRSDYRTQAGTRYEGERLPFTRYDTDLWRAFTSLPAGERYVVLGERVHVIDLPVGSAVPENAVKIERDDIGDRQDGFLAISGKIEAWAARNKADITKFKNSGAPLGKKSLLDSIIEALSDEELRQLQLPMGVIKILNSKRI
jgi:hypothetical protein